MQSIRARMTVLTVAAVCVAVALAACGSSSSSSSSSTKAAAAGGAVTSAARTKLVACLKQHGVTLPARPAGGHRPGAGSSAPGAGGGGGGGGGAPGSAPGAGGGGFFGGGGGSSRFSNPKFQAAFKACGGAAGFRGGQGRFARFRPSKTAIATFAACVKKHGYTLPKANTSGKGSVYPVSVERSAKFQAATRSCAADLRPAGGAPAPAG